jgi:hypothetical protein
MTPQERIAKASQARFAFDEFIGPMLDALHDEYTSRLVEIASTELHPAQRSDKITALSNALKIVANLKAGMIEAIRDGELAKIEKLRAERVEQMSDAQQRLLKITGY